MKRIFTFLLAGMLVFSLCGCNLLASVNTGTSVVAGGNASSICIEAKATVVVEDENGRYEYTTVFTHDEVVRRADGFIEIRGTSSVDGVTSKIRWIYTADGKQIARRTYENGSYSDYSAVFDSTVDSYALYLEGVASVNGNTIHYTDGAREEVKVNAYGLTESFRIYNAGADTPYIDGKTEYTMLAI